MTAHGSATHTVERQILDGRAVVTLGSPAGVTASFVPGTGMLATSFTLDGVELLAVDDAGGIDGYETGTSMCGIPLLHPWANRLRRRGGATAAGNFAFADDARFVRVDANGLPIHGLGAALRDWTVTTTDVHTSHALIRAGFDSGRVDGYDSVFPFPYALSYEAVLRDSSLTLTVECTASGTRPVPVAFGLHPYLCLAGVPRDEWVVHVPVRTRVVLDDRMLPTGELSPAVGLDGPLGDRTFDDLYCDVRDGDRFVLAGGGRRISVTFDDGWTHAMVWAPLDPVTVSFEPMTASIDPFDGPFPCRVIAPGESFRATCTLSAERDP